LRWFADRIDGRLAAAREAKLASHLASGCAACVAREASLRGSIAALASGPLPAAPRDLIRAASRLHAQARFASVVDAVRRVVAKLVFDGAAAPAFALRAAPGDERRMLWTAGPWDIDACLLTGAAASDLLGQVVPHDEAAGAAATGALAARCGSKTRRARLDAEGRFAFRGLAPGVWTIEGRVGGTDLAVPPFVVERAG
jgi:hypothetical protein